MCLIVDANCCHLLKDGCDDGKLIRSWMIKKGHMATGGKNYDELRLAGMGRLLKEYRTAGKLKVFTQDRLKEQSRHIDQRLMRSNDLHVIELVRVSGSRLVFTKDVDLQSDLRNASLVPKRKGTSVCFYRSKNDRKKLFQSLPCHD